MSFSEELVAEQENLLRQLHAKQEENNSITKLGTTIVYRMGSLKTKLKVRLEVHKRYIYIYIYIYRPCEKVDYQHTDNTKIGVKRGNSYWKN